MDPPPQLARKRSRRSKDRLVRRRDSSGALEEVASSGDLVTLSAAAAAEAAAAEAAVAAAATTAAASATSISQPTQDFKNHPTVRTYRNEYSNWRRGATRGSSGELTNDRLSGRTVRTKHELLLYRDEIHSTYMSFSEKF